MRLIERLLEMIKHLPPTEGRPAPRKEIKWTGKIVNLVEVIYAFDTIKCIDHGDADIEDLADYLGEVFGIDIKHCFNTYVDMKKRQGNSRTYFLDEMSRRLNERMTRDDQK